MAMPRRSYVRVEESPTRVCKACGIEKPHDGFYVNRLAKSGKKIHRFTRCISCTSQAHKDKLTAARAARDASINWDVKTCSNCNVEKPLSDYYINKRTTFNRIWKPRKQVCKVCQLEKQRVQSWETWVAVVVQGARTRADERGIPFDLTREYVLSLVPEDGRCPVFGVEMTMGLDENGKKRLYTPSLDRIIPSRGYVKGNVAIISLRANNIKNDSTPDDLRNVLKWLENQAVEQ